MQQYPDYFNSETELEDALSTPTPKLTELMKKLDGDLIFLETSGVPYFDSQGRFLGYQGVDRDITERMKLQEEVTRVMEKEVTTTCVDAIGNSGFMRGFLFIGPNGKESL